MTNTWHELRSKNIGGSDIAALFGESPYSTLYKLWHEKRGLIEPDSLDDVERIQAGNYLEKAIIEWANDKWGYDFYQPQEYVEHATVNGMACTPDAYLESYTSVMSQVKNVDSLQFYDKWEYEGDLIVKCPIHILLQVQHEMECCGRKTSVLIVAVGGNRLYKMECKADPEIAAILRCKVMEFWLMDEAPEPDFKKDSNSIRELRNKMRMDKQEDYSNDKDFYKMLKKATKLKHQIKVKQDELDLLESEIYYLSADNQEIRCNNIRVSYSKRKGTPDKVITADDVGKTIKGRKPSSSMKITMEEIAI